MTTILCAHQGEHMCVRVCGAQADMCTHFDFRMIIKDSAVPVMQS